ncbi:MAG: hypothetical protein J7L14_00765, partial [Candidatus Diapherotrites archaeon]|nr:hypothetical protein [Candidatus Diapherotrites archaeon]
RIMRANLQPGKQIKREVKEELNKWLAEFVAIIARKMDSYPYRSVDLWMLQEAIRPYVKIEELETEKERLIKQLEAIKAECDVLINEVDEQFSLRDRIARKLAKKTEQ